MAETFKGLNMMLTLDGKDLENELKGIQSELKEQQRGSQSHLFKSQIRQLKT